MYPFLWLYALLAALGLGGFPRRAEAHHEQSETTQLPGGEWANIYGRQTPLAGMRLPRDYSFESPGNLYPTEPAASHAAGARSHEYERAQLYGP